MKSDDDLHQTVLEELDFDPELHAAHIDVVVKNRVVTLRGTVSSYAEKLSAEDAVKRVSGVQVLTDELIVDIPLLNHRHDDDIARAAMDALYWNVNVPHERIKVHVHNGWLTLEGDVEWHFSMNNAKRAVQFLTGVRGVTNHLLVKQPIAAQDIKAKLAQAFRRNVNLDPDQIDIAIYDGGVTLRGNVRSWEEFEDATRAAYSLPGVEHVENLTHVGSRRGSPYQAGPRFEPARNNGNGVRSGPASAVSAG